MHRLELKIPPVVLVLLIAVAMWGVSLATMNIALPIYVRVFAAITFVAAGAGISVAGVIAFKRAKTTVNPTKPDSTSALVRENIYGFTRNPMYLGFLLALVGWAVFLSNAVALLGAVFFVLYMNRFQIVPEERVLTAMFGAEFVEYKAKVRRWL